MLAALLRRPALAFALCFVTFRLSSPAQSAPGLRPRATPVSSPLPPASVRFRLADGLIYLPVSLFLPAVGAPVTPASPGRRTPEPLNFVLDTAAAGTSLDPKIAAALSSPEGNPPGTPFLLSVGPTRLTTTTLLPTAYITELTGLPTAGVLGTDLLTHAILSLDYSRQLLTVLLPAQCATGGESLPLTIAAGLPFAEAELLLANGQKLSGLFLLDTAQSGPGITLTAAFAAAHPELPATTPLLRIAGLRLGLTTLAEPILAVSQTASATPPDPRLAGVLGADILRRFNLVFDLPHRRLFLRPNPAVHDPFETDMSGLTLRALATDPRRITVAAVAPGSPAANAHVLPGDELVSVDGKPAPDLAHLRALLRSAPGRTVQLELQRGRQQLRIRLTLRSPV